MTSKAVADTRCRTGAEILGGQFHARVRQAAANCATLTRRIAELEANQASPEAIAEAQAELAEETARQKRLGLYLIHMKRALGGNPWANARTSPVAMSP